MSGSSWQDAEVARRFLDERRAAIPYALDQLEMLLHLTRHFLGIPRRVLDLGCGDGLLARTVLQRYAHARATLIDHSNPMLQRARRAMREFADRCTILHGDLSDPLDRLIEGPFDLIVSGYTIHHLPRDRKRSLYKEIFEHLTPDGLFIHIEHVASTPRSEALFDELYIDQLAAHNGRNRDVVAREYHARPDKADNKLEPVERQLEWLREIGFIEVDCYFRWLNLVVFAGQRPNARGLAMTN